MLMMEILDVCMDKKLILSLIKSDKFVQIFVAILDVR